MEGMLKKTAKQIFDEKLMLNRWGNPCTVTYIRRLGQKGKIPKKIEGNITYYFIKPTLIISHDK